MRNNPIGGMGLTGEHPGRGQSGQKLARTSWWAATSERLLDLYDGQRRAVAVEFVQEQSIANKKRLEATDPAVGGADLDGLRAMAADPARARAFLLADLDDRQPAPRPASRRGGRTGARRSRIGAGRPMKLAVPDLISNSYFPAVAAVELGFFKHEGLDVSLELIFPVDNLRGACVTARSISSAARRIRRWPRFRSGRA